MAVSDGVFATNTQTSQQARSVKLEDTEDLFVGADRSTPITVGNARPIDDILVGTVIFESTAMNLIVRNGAWDHKFGDEQLFHRVWFSPTEIDAGFIVEDVNHTVSIWNANFDQIVTLTDIDVDSADGTTLQFDTPPVVVNKFWEKIGTLTVTEDGPPTQNTTYTFTVSSIEYDLVITGIRVVTLEKSPEWTDGVRFEMVFETALTENRWAYEQRRPLRPDAFRKTTVKYVGQGVDAQRLRQKIMYGHDKVYGVPVFHEPIELASDPQSSSTITSSNTLTYYWHLNNQCNYIVLYDYSTWTAEIKEISSVGSTSIVLVNVVADSFDPLVSIAYPVYMGTMEQARVVQETHDIMAVSVEYKEFLIGDE